MRRLRANAIAVLTVAWILGTFYYLWQDSKPRTAAGGGGPRAAGRPELRREDGSLPLAVSGEPWGAVLGARRGGFGVSLGRFGWFWGRFGVPARHHGSGSAGRCCAGGGWVPFSPGTAAARPAPGAASLKIMLITRQPRGRGGPAVLQNVPVLLGSGRAWSSAVYRTPPQRGESCPEPPMPCVCRACGSGSFSLSSPHLPFCWYFLNCVDFAPPRRLCEVSRICVP